MKQEKLTKADRLIESGVGALRTEHNGAHDARRVIDALHAPRRPRRTLATVAVVGVLAMGAVFFIPRDSAAAGLSAVSRALQNMPSREETHYVDKGDGVFELELTVIVDGEQAVLEQADGTVLRWEKDRVTTDFQDYSTVQNAQKPEWAYKTFILREWLNMAVAQSVKRKVLKPKEWKLDFVYRDLKLDPQLVIDRYDFDIVIDDAIGAQRFGHITFDVDQTTLRPIVVQSNIQHMDPIQIKFDYDLTQDRFDPRTTKPVRVYDIDQQREQITHSLASPLMSAVAGEHKVLLHAAVVDHDGNLTFIYSDTDAMPLAMDKRGILPKEMLVEGPTLSMMPMGITNGILDNQPALYKDLRIALVSVKLYAENTALESLKSVRLPIVRNGTTWWAEFSDVSLMRTGNSLMLISPMNVPFFVKGSAETVTGG